MGKISGLLLFSTPLVFLCIIFIIKSILFFILLIIKKLNLELSRKLSQATLMVSALLLFFFALFFLGFSLRAFHKSFRFPDGCRNIENLEVEIFNANKQPAVYEILYFNDKYIFVQYKAIGSLKSTIEVFKFDDFFKKDKNEK